MNLLKALLTVSSMTLISRVLGFVRDAVIARAFGAGLYTDAFFVAFRLPNLLRRVFAEGAFSQAFVPILAEYKARSTEEQTRDLVDHVASLLAVALFVVTLIGTIAAPLIIYATAPGFSASPQKFDLTVALLRITFPYILFISLTSLAGSILNTYGRFAIPAFTPTLLNVAFIVFALWLAPLFDPPVMALAWAVLAGGVLQLGFQLPYLRRIGMLPRPRWKFRHLLQSLGPYNAIAHLLERKGYPRLPENTVSAWAHRNSIPSAWLPAVIELALEARVIGGINDLKETPNVRRSRNRTQKPAGQSAGGEGEG